MYQATYNGVIGYMQSALIEDVTEHDLLVRDHIWIQAHTYFQRNEDWTAQDTAPVPEFALIALLVIPIASFFVYKILS